MDKLNVVYSCNGILFGNKKEVLPDATRWMNPENIIQKLTEVHIL